MANIVPNLPPQEYGASHTLAENWCLTELATIDQTSTVSRSGECLYQI
jgi:hypothetical protein